MKVAVVGGGVCGLTCAVALTKAGIDVQIYEAAVSKVHLHLTGAHNLPERITG